MIVSSAVDDFVIDSIESFQDAAQGAGQTNRYIESGFDRHEGSTEPGAGNVTMSWTFFSSDFNLIALNIKKVAVAVRRIFTVT